MHAAGLLRKSFRPALAIAPLRYLMCHRREMLEHAAMQLHLMQKVLTEVNLEVQHVFSDIDGASAQAIVEAILAGERDAQVSAKLRDRRCKSPLQDILEALNGEFRPEYLFVLRRAWDAWQNTPKAIAACDVQLGALADKGQSPERRTSSSTSSPESAPTWASTRQSLAHLLRGLERHPRRLRRSAHHPGERSGHTRATAGHVSQRRSVCRLVGVMSRQPRQRQQSADAQSAKQAGTSDAAGRLWVATQPERDGADAEAFQKQEGQSRRHHRNRAQTGARHLWRHQEPAPIRRAGGLQKQPCKIYNTVSAAFAK